MLGAFSRRTLPGLVVRSRFVGTPAWKSAWLVSIGHPLTGPLPRRIGVATLPDGTSDSKGSRTRRACFIGSPSKRIGRRRFDEARAGVPPACDLAFEGLFIAGLRRVVQQSRTGWRRTHSLRITRIGSTRVARSAGHRLPN